MAENWFTKPGFREHFINFPRKNSKTQSSLNFLQSDPRDLLNQIFWDWPRSGGFLVAQKNCFRIICVKYFRLHSIFSKVHVLEILEDLEIPETLAHSQLVAFAFRGSRELRD